MLPHQLEDSGSTPIPGTEQVRYPEEVRLATSIIAVVAAALLMFSTEFSTPAIWRIEFYSVAQEAKETLDEISKRLTSQRTREFWEVTVTCSQPAGSGTCRHSGLAGTAQKLEAQSRDFIVKPTGQRSLEMSITSFHQGTPQLEKASERYLKIEPVVRRVLHQGGFQLQTLVLTARRLSPPLISDKQKSGLWQLARDVSLEEEINVRRPSPYKWRNLTSDMLTEVHEASGFGGGRGNVNRRIYFAPNSHYAPPGNEAANPHWFLYTWANTSDEAEHLMASVQQAMQLNSINKKGPVVFWLSKAELQGQQGGLPPVIPEPERHPHFSVALVLLLLALCAQLYPTLFTSSSRRFISNDAR